MNTPPILHIIDQLNRSQEQRYAWLKDVPEKVRRWKAEDRANLIEWGGDA